MVNKKQWAPKKNHYPNNNNPIRTAARALIIQNQKILLVTLKDESGLFYVLPGGGQKHGEQLCETVQRECYEELGIRIMPGELLYLREYIGKNHTFSERHRNFHQVEVVFKCIIEDDHNIGNGPEEDMRQVGYIWLPLSELKQQRIFPEVVKSIVSETGVIQIPKKYLGDIN